MKLTIISHTEHYKTADGTIVGLGSTVTEINHLLEVFDSVVHVAMLHQSQPPSSALPYNSKKITFIPLPAVGGPKLWNKLDVIWKSPRVLRTIKKALRDTDVFQFRAPTGIGVFVIPYLILFTSKHGWFKYAGNWKQEHAPLAYAFQRWLLKNQNRVVTINGKWSNQPKQCLSFENPCLSLEDVLEGQSVLKCKSFTGTGIHFCFVGRLEEAKGIGLLIKAFKALTSEEKSKINTIHIVGHGKARFDYEALASDSGLNFQFHGFLSRPQVQEIYKIAHAIILPSASEGFPKVIAEAMNFGALPIVSNVSSISHYIQDKKNGFLLNSISEESLLLEIRNLLKLSNLEYSEMIKVSKDDLEKFTYSYYNKRLEKEVLLLNESN